MKLSEHVDKIRQIIDKAFRNRLNRMGIDVSDLKPLEKIPEKYRNDRERLESIYKNLVSETDSKSKAFEKLVEELTFTLFNRLAAIKVMEAHSLHPEIVTQRIQHGDRSFAHKLWLEDNPEKNSQQEEGLLEFLEEKFDKLSKDIQLFSLDHPFHLLPTAIELKAFIVAFNKIESDKQVQSGIWKSDDILGWLYESYNNYKKIKHKESGKKTEYNDVSFQSQVYTPRWVVKFLLDNSLGKFYLEMFPDSGIKDNYKIANIPKTQTRDRKPITKVRLIDPACGSGNFLLYAFDLFYDLYMDQIQNYGVTDYSENDIPELIIKNNLYGIDLDDRSVQLTQLGLYIKIKRRKGSSKIDHFNIVSSDFFLPNYEAVKNILNNGENIGIELEKIVIDLWKDLQQAYKFGSLIRLKEKFAAKLDDKIEKWGRGRLFEDEKIANYKQFRMNFFNNLEKAVDHNLEKQGINFINTKTRDAISFLKLLTQKYDIAVANPPYTDSGDFGPELKEFINANYKEPYKFHGNLYAVFIKRCFELTNNIGYVALIHPHTFMFIKKFEDVRKFIIEKAHIDLLVDYGLDRVNLFGPGILLDAVWYVFNKNKEDLPGVYFNITGNQQEKYKKISLEHAFDDLLNNCKNDRLFKLSQIKLKIIEGWPFIYWISDGFREKFKGDNLNDVADIRAGIQTSKNYRFLRLWWEIGFDNIIKENNEDTNKKRWVLYSKGGPYNKWYGNLWCTIDWKNDGNYLKKYLNSIGQDLHAQEYYFMEGITYSSSGSKGISFRYLDNNCLFDIAGSSIFLNKTVSTTEYLLGFLNSQLTFYIAECLNRTVNIQPQDLKRIPYTEPCNDYKEKISILTTTNINIKKQINSFCIIEINFKNNPISTYPKKILKDRIIDYLNHENGKLTLMLINEAIINNLIFEIYGLKFEDCKIVENKMGKTIGSLPLVMSAKDSFLSEINIKNEITKEFIKKLETISFNDEKIKKIKNEFKSLYQNNNDLEEFCKRHKVNPINVWYWFCESKILPSDRAKEIALEFLADSCRKVLMEDEDGVIPLVGLPGEPKMVDRLEQYCINNGFTTAQFMQLDGLLGKPVNEYLENHFFKNFSDHLNLFMYLPKTPFIWHLSSGQHQGFEAYIIIYKWNRDSLFKIKTKYLQKRKENLEYRQIQLRDINSAQAQNEKEKIRYQLQEIETFKDKVNELIAEGYDPKLDDGVGKNIAPLQKKGLLRYEVLNSKQLKKYLEADW